MKLQVTVILKIPNEHPSDELIVSSVSDLRTGAEEASTAPPGGEPIVSAVSSTASPAVGVRLVSLYGS